MYFIRTFDTLDSTNDECKRNYQNYQDQSVILAKRQTCGRGRFDRVWESEDDLTFSILYKETICSPILFPLAVVNACALFHQKAMIKWPNDILINQKKVCGILIESIYEGNDKKATIVGIGVNLSKKSVELQDKACYLNVDATTFLHVLLEQIEQLQKQSQQALLAQYQHVHMLYHKTIQLDDRYYRVEEVQLDGSLKVVCDKGVRYLYAGEVTLEQIYKEDN